MKKTLIMYAMLFPEVAMASPQFTTTADGSMAIQVQEKKVKIEADAPPEPVKTSINGNGTINKFPSTETWQIT